MRARLKWILGVLGVAWLIAYLRRRHAPREIPPDPRAEELRRTLEESREAAAAGTPPEPEAEPEAPEDVTARRRDVHERGRSALDEMAPPGSE